MIYLLSSARPSPNPHSNLTRTLTRTRTRTLGLTLVPTLALTLPLALASNPNPHQVINLLSSTEGQITAGGYAVVGAAAMAAGVTRTISTAVIVFELTGQLNHMLPVLVAVLLACGVGNLINNSIYDTMMKLNSRV